MTAFPCPDLHFNTFPSEEREETYLQKRNTDCSFIKSNKIEEAPASSRPGIGLRIRSSALVHRQRQGRVCGVGRWISRGQEFAFNAIHGELAYAYLYCTRLHRLQIVDNLFYLERLQWCVDFDYFKSARKITEWIKLPFDPTTKVILAATHKIHFCRWFFLLIAYQLFQRLAFVKEEIMKPTLWPPTPKKKKKKKQKTKQIPTPPPPPPPWAKVYFWMSSASKALRRKVNQSIICKTQIFSLTQWDDPAR